MSELDNDELIATRRLNGLEDNLFKSADEMFEELGYKIMFDNTCKFRYVKHFSLKPARHIVFAIDKTISVCEENKNELAINRDYFTMQELQAINKKCKELGWI